MEAMINFQSLAGVMIYSFIGSVVFAVSFKVLDILVPGNFWHEIIEEHNNALAIIIGALGIGLSIIIAAAIKG